MGGKNSGGHNKKTIEQHLQEGTYRKDRHGSVLQDINEITVISECPDWLGYFSRKEWKRVCHKYQEEGRLVQLDVSVLEAYCAAYGRWKEAEKELRSGFTYEYMAGKTLKLKRVEKPEVRIAKDALSQVKAYQELLGLISKQATMPVKPDKRTELEVFLDKVPGI